MAPRLSEPSYNLKAVVRETGLKPDTLRVWERRYGLPQPKRTSGGHRLYSQQDIKVLKWLVARQQEGLSISRAVELWGQLEGTEQLLGGDSSASRGVGAGTGQSLAQLRAGWIAACLEFDERGAERLLSQAFALYPAEMACMELLMPALAQLGEGWLAGHYTVQQEHFASALVIRRLEALLAATPAPSRAERMIVGCPPEEEHILGPLLLSLLLRRRGWDVIYLGANVPLVHLESTVTRTRPELIILAAQRLPSAASLQAMAFELEQQPVSVAFGGQIFNTFPLLQQRIPGHFLGSDLQEALRVIEQLLLAPGPSPTIGPISAAYQAALTQYRQHHPLIEAQVWETLGQRVRAEEQWRGVGYHLSRNITAALTLGDMAFLPREVTQVSLLIVNHHPSPAGLCLYLKAYLAAAVALLGEAGAPVVAWLAQVVAHCDQFTPEPTS